MRAVTFQAPGEVARRGRRPSPSCSTPTTRSSASRRAACAARTCTSTTAACRSNRASRSATSTSARSIAVGDAVTQRGRRRPRARLLPDRLRHLLLLPPRQLPQVRRRRARSATARRSARCRARRPSRRSCPQRRPRRCAACPRGMSDDVALFAGDVMGTGYHAAAESGLQPGDTVAVLGLGPGRAVRGAGRARRRRRAGVAIDTVPDRLAMAESFGAAARAPDRGGPARRRQARRPTAAASTSCIDAVGDPRALELAIRLTRKCGTVQCDRRLRRALRGAHGPALDQGADACAPATPT